MAVDTRLDVPLVLTIACNAVQAITAMHWGQSVAPSVLLDIIIQKLEVKAVVTVQWAPTIRMQGLPFAQSVL